MLVEALKSYPCGVLGEELLSLLEGIFIPTCGVPFCPYVGGGGATNERCISTISFSLSS